MKEFRIEFELRGSVIVTARDEDSAYEKFQDKCAEDLVGEVKDINMLSVEREYDYKDD